MNLATLEAFVAQTAAQLRAQQRGLVQGPYAGPSQQEHARLAGRIEGMEALLAKIREEEGGAQTAFFAKMEEIIEATKRHMRDEVGMDWALTAAELRGMTLARELAYVYFREEEAPIQDTAGAG